MGALNTGVAGTAIFFYHGQAVGGVALDTVLCSRYVLELTGVFLARVLVGASGIGAEECGAGGEVVTTVSDGLIFRRLVITRT